MEFKPLNDINDILTFLTKNINEFPDNKIKSIIDTVKEKKLEILLQSRTSKEKFDFSEEKNYPISAKKIIEIVNKNSKNKVSPFEIAEFFGIKVTKILNTDKPNELAYIKYKHDLESIEIFYKDFSNKGAENINEFLIAHELGHLFNHFLLGTFFEDEETYTLKNHQLTIENLSKAISIENISNHNTLIANQILSKKISSYDKVAFSTDKKLDNSFEIEADLFAFNLLFYPKEVSLTEVASFRTGLKLFLKTLK